MGKFQIYLVRELDAPQLCCGVLHSFVIDLTFACLAQAGILKFVICHF
jgi:hypothetical protein